MKNVEKINICTVKTKIKQILRRRPEGFETGTMKSISQKKAWQINERTQLHMIFNKMTFNHLFKTREGTYHFCVVR